MNFLDQVKHDIEMAIDPRRSRMLANSTGQAAGAISLRALVEVINAYERLDAEMRSLHNAPIQLGERLHNNIIALYHESGKNYERVFLVIMATLLPLLEDKEKRAIKNNPDPLDPENFPRVFR